MRWCHNLNQTYSVDTNMEKLKKTTKPLRQGAQASVPETSNQNSPNVKRKF